MHQKERGILDGPLKKYGCLSHKLITAKVNGYGFGFNLLKLVNNYLSHRKQRTKLNHSKKFMRKSTLSGASRFYVRPNIV